MDERRTPYAITGLGRVVFDEWLSPPLAGRGASFDDDISARALFLGESEAHSAAAVLPLLLARRLRQAAADIELVEGLSELTGQRRRNPLPGCRAAQAAAPAPVPATPFSGVVGRCHSSVIMSG